MISLLNICSTISWHIQIQRCCFFSHEMHFLRFIVKFSRDFCRLFQYYVLYYTINTSIPFEQWSTIRISSRPFYILPISIPANVQLFIRVASVNAKGSTLSDFHMINHSLLNSHLISSTIDNFQCFSSEPNQSITLKWSIDHRSHELIKNYIVYYSDLTQTNDNCLQTHLIPIDTIKIVRHLSKDLCEYKFNTSLLKLNYNKYHILRLDLAIIDQDENQLAMTSPSIYSTFPRKSGKQRTRVPFLIDRFSGRNWLSRMLQDILSGVHKSTYISLSPIHRNWLVWSFHVVINTCICISDFLVCFLSDNVLCITFF